MKTEKKTETNTETKFSIKERIIYWFNNSMEKGSLSFIRFLIAGTIIFALIFAAIIVIMGFHEDSSPGSVFWDSIATVINAWVPSSGDGSPGYLLMMTMVAIVGVLFTSVLIGIITSAIEEKIYSLRRGYSLVLEKNHTIVLGFCPGEYSLLNQLILSAGGKPACVLVAENMDLEDMEYCIEENLDIPKNFRIVCRTVDITDPASLKRCCVETCRTVIVSPMENMRTIKAILAVSALLEEKGVSGVSINAIISRDEYQFPPSIAEAHHITALQTYSIMARIIAHSCTQTGLSEIFREIFNFEGSEFYLINVAGIRGLKFEDLMARMSNATPAGVWREGTVILNPAWDFALQEADRVLVFAETADAAKMLAAASERRTVPESWQMDAEEDADTVIIGYNETLPVILSELPENVSRVCLAVREMTEQEKEALDRAASERGLCLHYYEDDPHTEQALLELARMAEHIVILNDHDSDPEEADMEAIFLLVHLRDLRKRFGLKFNITLEMQKEQNQRLVGYGDHTDFLVSTSMSSLFLAQLAESPELGGVFSELLSNEGNELYLKKASFMKLEGDYSVRDLRLIMLHRGYILLGVLDAEKNSRFNLPLQEVITLTHEDSLIVLGEK